VRFTRALVRRPSRNLADGLTQAQLGAPSIGVALAQHDRYCEELARCGLELTRLPVDARYPDATFVEDAAIITRRGAVVMRPGAVSRQGEVDSVREALADLAPILGTIEAPGCVDGGDICEASGRYLIGLSGRTNEAGAAQLAGILERAGYEAATVDVRGIPGLLNLKGGLASLDGGVLVAVEALAGRSELRGFDVVRVEAGESYAANCLSINGRVLLARGFPRLESALTKLGRDVVTLEMSEFRKMDGGLSCLSLRL